MVQSNNSTSNRKKAILTAFLGKIRYFYSKPHPSISISKKKQGKHKIWIIKSKDQPIKFYGRNF